MLTRNRREWEAMAQQLASDGIGALAMDLRGHGESGAGPLGPPDRVDYSTMVLDLRAARRFLAQRSDVQQTRVGVAGASLGANLAALLASSDPSIASLALLSPSLDYRGLRIEAAARKVTRPMLLVASRRRPVCVAVGARAAEGRRRTARAADPEAGRPRYARCSAATPTLAGCAGGLVSANVAMILVPCPDGIRRLRPGRRVFRHPRRLDHRQPAGAHRPQLPRQRATRGGSGQAQTAPPFDESRATALEATTAKNPATSSRASQLGNLYFDAERFADATRWYEAALKIEPEAT